MTYSLILVFVALASGLCLAWTLNRTRVGKLLLTVIHDPDISRALGIDVGRFYLVTFTFGSLLAAIGAVIVGLVRSVSIHYVPQVELFVIYLVMALVLTFRPRGLFSIAEARKI